MALFFQGIPGGVCCPGYFKTQKTALSVNMSQVKISYHPRSLTLAMVLLCLSIPAITSNAQNAGRLHINEVMVANVDRYLDTSWNYGSWVEIYNSSDNEINLKRYYINTSNSRQDKIGIGYDLVIPAHGYGVLWFGHKYWKAPTQIDAELDNDGGYITLFSPGSNVLDRVEYPASMSRCSWARCSDGSGKWTYTSCPTPAATNGRLSEAVWQMPAPVVDTDSRFFPSIQNIKVEIPEGATLIYTTDGSTPSRTNGEISETGTFRTAASRVYRFVLIKDGYLDSPIVTRSYIRRQQRINVPALSIVTDPAHLYDDKIGFFVQGTNGRAGKGTDQRCNWNMDWERPVNVEFITQDNVCHLNQEVWMTRCGGHSKGFTPMSFKIRASKDFDGRNTLDYAFFPDKPYLRHKALQFRNGGNDFECRIYDAALQSLVRTSGIDMDLQDYQPVVHYINGRFMGTINMREPNNKHNVLANHGLKEEEIDMFEIECDSCYVQMCGTRDAWDELLELSASATDESVYSKILDRIDLDEFCNYMAVQFYLGNTDWPQNNCKAWRPIEENGKFRFILYDLDFAFSSNSPFSRFNSVSYYTFCQLFDVPGVSHFTREVELVRLFKNLCKNRNFALHFVDAFSLVGGSVFELNRCSKLIKQYATAVENVQMIESGYPNRNASPWPSANKLISSFNNWQNGIFSALRSYFSSVLSDKSMREVSFSANIPQAGILMNGQQVPLGKFKGNMFLPATLEVTAPDGYRFVGWKDAQTGNLLSENRVMELTRSSVRGELEACYDKEYTGKPVMINEVSAGNSVYVNEYFKKKDWLEIYNPSPSSIDIKGMYLSDDLSNPTKYRIEGRETVIPAGGFKIIWCDDMPSEQYLHANFKLANADGALVMLSASDQSWQDTLIYCAHNGRETVGRFPDGGRQLYKISRPTIEGGNAMNSYSVQWDPYADEEIVTGLYATSEGDLSLRWKEGILWVNGDGPLSLSVFTLSGTMVMNQALHAAGSPLPVNLHPLRKGIYVVRLSDAEGNKCSIKLDI